ncbi:MAG: division/cell wall cluster transcriptional repressor MraZ [Bacteroidota bacterium]
MATTNLIGEYECRLDEKGRIIFPSGLKKQLAAEYQDKFVVNRGFEGCLVIHPMDVWNEISTDVNKLNKFVEENRRFMREFHNGATEVVLDGQNRFLIPKILVPHASIDKEVILFAYANRIELWDKATYRKMMSMGPDEYARLAEKVMGKQE